MSDCKDGGPAFPHRAIAHYVSNWKSVAEPVYTTEGGMSLRDWFAGQALVGILAGPASRDGVPVCEWYDIPPHAYQLADAMLAARSKSGGE